ncbi:MAG: flagellar motor protein MotB [Deltaproteobacteria bacterium]|nr:flagellar motor protein MotB [Deltaproteobacteria bacterium]
MAIPPKFEPPVLPGSRARLPLPLMGAVLIAIALSVVAYTLYHERAKTNALVGSTQKNLAAATARVAELEARKLQLEADKEALETAKAELSKSVEAKEGELHQLKGTYDSFRQKMKAEIARGDINLEQTGGRLRVGMVDKILFDPGEAQISKRGEAVLARVAEALSSIPDKQIQVSGHTDTMPINSPLAEKYPTNWELSTARATQVVRFLAEKAGVPPQRLVASGYGEFHPIAGNKTPAGRARNRRIEILLTPMLAPRTMSKAKLEAAVEKQADKRAKADKRTDKRSRRR